MFCSTGVRGCWWSFGVSAEICGTQTTRLHPTEVYHDRGRQTSIVSQYILQAGLKFLTSNNPPASASRALELWAQVTIPCEAPFQIGKLRHDVT